MWTLTARCGGPHNIALAKDKQLEIVPLHSFDPGPLAQANAPWPRPFSPGPLVQALWCRMTEAEAEAVTEGQICRTNVPRILQDIAPWPLPCSKSITKAVRRGLGQG